MSRMNRNNEPLEMTFRIRIVILLISVALIVGGLLLWELVFAPAIILVLIGCMLAFFAAGGMHGKTYRRRDTSHIRHRQDDVPLNPWDSITAGEEQKKK